MGITKLNLDQEVDGKNLTEEEAIEIAKEFERVSRARIMLRNTIKEYVEKNGELNTGEKIWRFNESVRWKFDSDGLEKIRKAMVLDSKDPYKYFSLPPSKIRDLEWADEILEAFGGTKSTTNRFGSRVVK